MGLYQVIHDSNRTQHDSNAIFHTNGPVSETTLRKQPELILYIFHISKLFNHCFYKNLKTHLKSGLFFTFSTQYIINQTLNVHCSIIDIMKNQQIGRYNGSFYETFSKQIQGEGGICSFLGPTFALPDQWQAILLGR